MKTQLPFSGTFSLSRHAGIGPLWRPGQAMGLLLAFFAASPAVLAAEFLVVRGNGAGISNNNALVGRELYRNLDSVSGTSQPDATLATSDDPGNRTGRVALSGNNAVLGDSPMSAAYFFRNLDTAAGTVTANVKLTASDSNSSFGSVADLSGNTAIVGNGVSEENGSAYLFRNLDTRSGTVTQDVKLISSGMQAHDGFGSAVSISGNSALVGALGAGADGGGQAYFYRSLDTATGTVTENVRLSAAGSDFFGTSVSLEGGTALVGGNAGDGGRGLAYIFRNLDTASGAVTQNLTLTTVERQESIYFGTSTSLSGNTALVGAPVAGAAGQPGSAYLFRNISSATGTIAENVKITPSDGVLFDNFGSTLALAGDQFVILGGRSSTTQKIKAYSGSVSSLTTLDSGGTASSIDGISFVSQDDWIIGRTTDLNQVSLTSGDSGTVSAAGKAVYIGQTAGSDNNTLTVAGTLTANQVMVGAAGNTGNFLMITGIVTTASGVMVAPGSGIGGDGILNGSLALNAGALLLFHTGTTLTVAGQVSLDPSFSIGSLTGLDSTTPMGTYTLIDGTTTDFASLGIGNWGPANAYDLGGNKSAYFEQGSLRVVVVPEPGGALLLMGAAGVLAFRRPGRRR